MAATQTRPDRIEEPALAERPGLRQREEMAKRSSTVSAPAGLWFRPSDRRTVVAVRRVRRSPLPSKDGSGGALPLPLKSEPPPCAVSPQERERVALARRVAWTGGAGVDKETLEQRWEELAEAVVTGMADWRVAHPRATFREIEAALDERLDRMRARILADAALASEATDWRDAPPEGRPRCPDCQTPLVVKSRQTRRLQSQGVREIELERSQGTCPQCGASLFPPR